MKYHAENRSVSYVYCNSRYFTVMAREKISKTIIGLVKKNVYKLGLSAEKDWRKIRGFRRLADVINGVKFIDCIDEETFERQRNATKSYSHSPHLTITKAIDLAYSRTTPYKLK